MSKSKQDSVLPIQLNGHPSATGKTEESRSRLRMVVVALAALSFSIVALARNGHLSRSLLSNERSSAQGLEPFYYTVNTHDNLCLGGLSHSGYIGLKGDSEHEPKRSFYWYVLERCCLVRRPLNAQCVRYFEAQHDPENAPVM
jgi:hypothetical protein